MYHYSCKCSFLYLIERTSTFCLLEGCNQFYKIRQYEIEVSLTRHLEIYNYNYIYNYKIIGDKSQSKLYRSFSQCMLVNYQCSPLSTPDGILHVFQTCSRYQQGKDLNKFVAVAVLDELGLAEDSNTMALKTLHPLLETGCSPEGKFDNSGIFNGDAAQESWKVGFIGISNWSLDPAKMNRGILVSRSAPDEHELLITAKELVKIDEQKTLQIQNLEKMRLLNEDVLRKIVKTHMEICEEQGNPEIFGLRDFYSCLKMLANEENKLMFGDSTTKSKVKNLTITERNKAFFYCMKRNYSSCDLSDVDPFEKFCSVLLLPNEYDVRKGSFISIKSPTSQCGRGTVNEKKNEQTHEKENDNENDSDNELLLSSPKKKKNKHKQKDDTDDSDNELLLSSPGKKKNSITKTPSSTSLRGSSECEGRLTHSSSSSSIPTSLSGTDIDETDIEQVNVLNLLRDNLRHSDNKISGSSESVRYPLIVSNKGFAALNILKETDVFGSQVEILFGSSFPEDHEYNSVCLCINRIKLCLEQGRVIVLINLGHIYESIYDALNQYYSTFGGNKYVDLGLGTHRVKCRVHPNARLVIIARKEEILREFPTPLINRLEKHKVDLTSVLNEKQIMLGTELQQIVTKYVKNYVAIQHSDLHNLCSRSSRTFQQTIEPRSVFVGHDEDTCLMIASKVTSTASAHLGLSNTTTINNGRGFKTKHVENIGKYDNVKEYDNMNVNDANQDAISECNTISTVSTRAPLDDNNIDHDVLVEEGKKLLLQTSRPEAIICMSKVKPSDSAEERREKKQIFDTYFKDGKRDLNGLLTDLFVGNYKSDKRTHSNKSDKRTDSNLVQLTTFSRLLTQVDLDRIATTNEKMEETDTKLVFLNEIQSETEFVNLLTKFIEDVRSQTNDENIDADVEDISLDSSGKTEDNLSETEDDDELLLTPPKKVDTGNKKISSLNSVHNHSMRSTKSNGSRTRKSSTASKRGLLVVQCADTLIASSGSTGVRNVYNNLGECARYIVQRVVGEAANVYVLFVIQLPLLEKDVGKFVGQPAGWTCMHWVTICTKD